LLKRHTITKYDIKIKTFKLNFSFRNRKSPFCITKWASLLNEVPSRFELL
jgi:hypothetical protein